jgi:hypothetical protein
MPNYWSWNFIAVVTKPVGLNPESVQFIPHILRLLYEIFFFLSSSLFLGTWGCFLIKLCVYFLLFSSVRLVTCSSSSWFSHPNNIKLICSFPENYYTNDTLFLPLQVSETHLSVVIIRAVLQCKTARRHLVKYCNMGKVYWKYFLVKASNNP